MARLTPEIGVRMALGAERKDVVHLVVRQALFVTVSGTALGAGLALVFTRFLATLLYGVRPTDPMVFAAIAALLLAVAWGACWIPARRAAKVDPVIALRLE